MANKRPFEPLTVKSVKQLDYVDDSLNYRCVIQIGASHKWRQFLGGKWEKDGDESADARGRKSQTYKHSPAIHETGPLSGKVVNGLISAHNEWEKANKGSQIEGQVQRQLLVLSTMQTDEVPPETGSAGPMRELIKAITESNKQMAEGMALLAEAISTKK